MWRLWQLLEDVEVLAAPDGGCGGVAVADGEVGGEF